MAITAPATSAPLSTTIETPIYDAIIVGAGHNGLTCACYLAKAGLSVLVLERRGIVGGAVCTETDVVPGYRMDVGSSAHIMIHLTPVLRDLELDQYGLEYIEMDPWGWYPIPGSTEGIGFYRSVERTCESIARVSPKDAEAYARFVEHWGELNEGIFESFLQPPTPGRIFWTMMKRNLRNLRSRKLWSSLDTSRQLMAPYGAVIDELFENEHLKSALLWLSAQSGPAPSEVASGDMFGWNAMIHRSGAKRAKGGSGALTQALAKRLVSDGGEILVNAEVRSITREGAGGASSANAKAQAMAKGKGGLWRVEFGGNSGGGTTTENGSASPSEGAALTRRVIGACHVQTLFDKLAAGDAGAAVYSKELRARVGKIRVGNGFGMIVRHAVSELPQYGESAASADGSRIRPCHSSLQLLCRSKAHLESSHRDFSFGLPPRDPSVVAMTFSAIDPTLAPAGRHTLFTWGQYHPYELSNGENWDAIAEREADKLYNLVCEYAPNMQGKMLGRYIQTPLEIERRLGMLRANVMHVEMSLDQMFFFRPLPELAAYTTPIPGVYLTGASTHPGGGVFAASGYNTAKVVLADWRKGR
ncbi:MAG TPA: NAD(P)/FAD-dependent oxidoreductase [Candidatus Methylacidiphilales bacterium]|nr:NAD(P)/FAD-dependent oxidoreductase [Candidatus Methylacidiphilales bacterium]